MKVASKDTAEATIVLSQIIAKERPRQAVLTVDVAIPVRPSRFRLLATDQRELRRALWPVTRTR